MMMNTSRKIGRMVGKRLPEFAVQPDPMRPHPHTSVGIEVEAEGIEEHAALEWDTKRWRVVGEGSLQGGCEFVSDPVWGTAIVDALDELGVYFADHPPFMSVRTSVHVHVNVLDMYPEHLERMIKGYVMYESSIYRMHEGRYNNIFCVPATESTVVQHAYAEVIRSVRNDRAPGQVIDSKYLGMNPNNLRGLGTLEFRQMGGTSDMGLILQWVDVLLRLKASAQDETIPLDNPDLFWAEQRSILTISDDDVADGALIVDKLALWS
jgi:Putative amidoligase enzyme